MTRLFSGRISRDGLRSHPELDQVGRPMINLVVALGQRREQVSFMIDTGADLTIVAPRRTKALFGAEFDYHSVPSNRRLPIAGIGPETVDTIIQPVGVLMTDVDARVYRFSQNMLFAVPRTGAAGVWRVPSVLGRDVLRRFELRLSYAPPTISLILNP